MTTSQCSGGSERRTSTGGKYATFTFNGTEFHLIGSKGASYGTALVTVDSSASYVVSFHAPSTAFQQRVLDVKGLTDTQHTVKVKCTSGLISFDAVDLVGALTTKADSSPPISTSNIDEYWHRGSFDVVLDSTDSLGGVADTFYSLNGGDLQSYVGTFPVSTEGANTLEFYSVDGRGNQEDTQTATVLVDGSAPSSSCDATSSWLPSSTIVRLTSNDSYSGLAGIRYTVNGSAAATYTTYLTVAAEGITTITYAGQDNVGNVEATKTATVKLDFTAPVTSSNATDSYVNTATIALSPSDSGSGVAQTQWRLDGSAWTSGTVASTTTVGTHTLEWRSTDNVGRVETTKSATFTVLKRFDQDDAAFTWKGTWSSSANASHFQGTARYANAAGAVACIGFTGSAFDWVSYRAPDCGIASVSLDGGAPTDVDLYSASNAYQQIVYSSRGLTNGYHVLRISWTGRKNASANDTKVGVDAFDVSGTMTPDTQAPVSMITANTAWSKVDVPVSLSASDTGTWVANTYYRIGSTTTTYTAPFSVSAEGVTSIEYWSVDGVGNIETHRVLDVHVDKTAPTTGDDFQDRWVKTRSIVHLTASDALSGVAATYYSLDGSAPTIPATSAVTISAEGTTTLKYYSVDTAGNASGVTTRQVRVDASAPVGSSDAPAGWVSGPVTLNLSATDAFSGVAGIRASINGAQVATVTGGIGITAEGTTTVDYVAVDNVGNADTTRSATVRIDHTAPQTNNNAPTGWNSSPVFVGLTASDAVSGVSATYYSTDGWITQQAYTSTITVLAQGATSLQYYSVDVKGNRESTQTATILIDDVAPETKDDAPGGWVTGTQHVTLTPTDAVSGVAGTVYSTDGTTPTVTYSSPVAISAEGTTTLKYRSSDVKGNVEDVQTTAVRIDNTPPSTGSDATGTYVLSATIHLSPADALSGVANTSWSLDGSAATSGTTVFCPFAVGTHTLEYRSTDNAGNAEATHTATFEMIGRIDDADARVVYQGGNWTTNANASRYQGSWHVVSAAGAAYLTFSGTYVDLIGSTAPGSGIAKVSVDDAFVGNADFYSAGYAHQARVFAKTGLSNTTHTIKVEWTGSKNASSTGTAVGVDAFDIAGVPVGDVVAPVTTSTADSSWRTTPETISLAATDTGTWVKNTYYRIGSTTTTYTVPFSVSAEGTTSVAFWSVDGAGNTETANTALVRIDTTAPNSSDDATSAWQSGPVTVHVTSSDTGSGVGSILYSLDGSTPSIAYPAEGITISAEGTTTLKYRAADILGNTESVKTRILRIDNTAPVTSDNAPSGWMNSTRAIALVASDTLSGIANCYVSLDGQLASVFTVPIVLSTEGTHTITYRSVDMVGNDETSHTVTVRIDDTAPVSTATVAPSYTATANITIVPSDTLSGLSQTTWRIDGSAWTSGTAISCPLSPGTHTLEYRSADNVGNVETTHSAMFEILGRTDDADGRVIYQGGNWTTNANASRYQGSWHVVSAAGAAYLTFSGTHVDLIGSTAPGSGIAKVSVDNTFAGNADFYSVGYAHQARVFGKTGLSNTTHTIKVEWTGSKNASSTGTAVGIDAFDILGVPVGDVVAPVTTSTADSSWRTTPETISLAATDTGTWVKNTYYRIGSTTTTYTVPFSVSAEGTTSVAFWSVDGAGNTETANTALVRIDTTAPNSSDDATSAWQSGPVTVHVTSSDTGSGVGSILYSLDGSTPSIAYPAEGITISAEGTTTLKYRAADILGNTESVKTRTLKIDNTAPQATDDAPSGWVGGPVTVHLDAADSLSGLAHLMVKVDGGMAVDFTSPITFSAQGTDTIEYWATDNVRNSTPHVTRTVEIDNAAPATTDDAPTGWVHGPVTVSLIASDSVSGVGVTWVSLNGATALPYTTPLFLTAEGTTTIEYWSVDAEGNAESHRFASVRIDNSSPITSDNAPTAWVGSATLLMLTPNDDGLSGVANTTYSVDGSTSVIGLGPIAFATEGTHTVSYRSVDNVGNAESTHTITLHVDVTAPVTTSTVAPSYTATANITIVPSDTLSGLAQTTWRIDGSAWTSGTVISCPLSPGTHTLEYRSADNAGNAETTHTATFEMIGRIDDADARVIYQGGNWTTNANASRYQGSWHVVSAAGAAYLTFSGTYVDLIGSTAPGSGIAKVSVDDAFVGNADFYSAGYAHQARVFAKTGLSNTTHTIKVEWTGSKNASSTGTAVGVDAFDIAGVPVGDVVAPVTTSTADSSWRTTPETISLAATDTGTWVKNTYYRIGSTTTTYTVPFSVSAEGTTSVAFWSVDGAGNTETANTALVRIDTTAPNSSDDATSAWQSGPVTVHVTSSDTGSGVGSILYSLDGSTPSIAYPAEGITISAEGTTTLKYRAADILGNTESVKTRILRIDNTAPSSADSVVNGWAKSPITLTASDAMSGVAAFSIRSTLAV